MIFDIFTLPDFVTMGQISGLVGFKVKSTKVQNTRDFLLGYC
jgi:hypothetical protein